MNTRLENTQNTRTFNFNGIDLTVILNEQNEPLFVAKEVTDILEIKNTTQAVNQLDEDEKLTYVLNRAGQNREVNIITESGLYSLILRSNKPEAKAFKKWITSEVLPSIRKHGAYMTSQKIEEVLLNPDTIIQLATTLKTEQEKTRLQQEQIKQQQRQIEQQKPMVLFAEALQVSNHCVLIGELAKILKQNTINIGQNRLFQWLRDNKYLISKGEQRNLPSQKALELGLFKVKTTTINNPDGSIRVTKTTKVTPKGQTYFINRFLK